jgi:hypothetical protein
MIMRKLGLLNNIALFRNNGDWGFGGGGGGGAPPPPPPPPPPNTKKKTQKK